jgi:hypothetical protein
LKNLCILQDPQYRRLHSSVDFQLANKLITTHGEFAVRERLNELNNEIHKRIKVYMTEAVSNSISSIQHSFFAETGPKWSEVSRKQPLVLPYFYFPFNDESKSAVEDEMMCMENADKAVRVTASHGWLGDDENPLKDFASEESSVYLR